MHASTITHMHAHTHACTHMHACTHACMQVHTHTHTHAHTPALTHSKQQLVYSLHEKRNAEKEDDGHLIPVLQVNTSWLSVCRYYYGAVENKHICLSHFFVCLHFTCMPSCYFLFILHVFVLPWFVKMPLCLWFQWKTMSCLTSEDSAWTGSDCRFV